MLGPKYGKVGLQASTSSTMGGQLVAIGWEIRRTKLFGIKFNGLIGDKIRLMQALHSHGTVGL
jgi:hypothetical protein